MQTKRQKRYVLYVLTLVYTLNFLDRNLIILLLQSIKEDLQLSDAQLGFLTGIAFGLFYATLGLPIARWADRGNRVTIATLAIALWSAAVMVCLSVTSYFQLALARMFAGVGEAGCMPPTYSLLGDYFPAPAERTRAMSFYWLASPFAALVSFAAGGWLNERYGWRVTFFLLGVPGLLLALLVRLTVPEPRQRSARPVAGKAQPRMTTLFGMLWRQHTSRHLSIGLILLYTMWLGLGPWYAAFLIRSHGMSTTELGLWLGGIFAIAGFVGIATGGYVASRWFADDERGQARLSAAAIALLLPFFLLFLLLPQKQGALLAFVPLMTLAYVIFGPMFALLQRLVADEIRASSLALVMLLANLIGMGLGPQVVGVVSDLLLPTFGTDSLRYAMLSMAVLSIWSATHFWLAGRTIADDLRAAAAT